MRPTDTERFCAKISIPSDPGECWMWRGWTDRDGYGKFVERRPSHRQWYAHRYAYTLLVGPIPIGLVIDHLCRVRGCVNPSHMEPVSIGENVLRGDTDSGANSRKTHCDEGHPLSGENLEIRPDGSRQCRICIGVKSRRYYWTTGRAARLAKLADPDHRRASNERHNELRRIRRTRAKDSQ